MHRYVYIDGIERLIYDYFSYGVISLIYIYNFLCFKQKKESLSRLSLMISAYPTENKVVKFFISKNFLAAFETVLTVATYLLSTTFMGIFGAMIGDVNNYFGMVYFIALLLLFTAYLIGLNPLKQADTFAPSIPFSLILAKIGCFFTGCCHGYEWKYGYYNMKTGLVEFPVQLLEATEALFIFIFLLCYKKKSKPGTLLPMFTILYSGLRFFSEFLRGEAEPMFWIIKPYHLFCIAGVILGVAEYWFITRYGNKLVEICKNSFICNFIEKRLAPRIKKKADAQKTVVHHRKKKKKNTKKTTRKK